VNSVQPNLSWEKCENFEKRTIIGRTLIGRTEKKLVDLRRISCSRILKNVENWKRRKMPEINLNISKYK